jgi:hypothetical protein
MSQRLRLIDLMAVVGVCFVLAGLLLPALNPGGASRRSQCANNLRQVALGLLQYEAHQGHFPPSVVSGSWQGPGHSCFAAILPYVDQQLMFNAYNFSVPSWHPANEPVVSQQLSIYTCPDNDRQPVPASKIVTADGRRLPGATNFGPGHYAVNWGGGRNGFGQDFVTRHGIGRGVMGENWGAKPEEIVDGASTTLLAGKKRLGQGWAVGGWGASEFDVGVSPCYQGNDAAAERVYTGSHHGTGAYFAFSDGSIRALFPSMDRKVWYALITRDGHEPVDLNRVE